MNSHRRLKLSGSLRQQVARLWETDAVTWPRLADGVASLRQAGRRRFPLGPARVEVLCNPARLASSAAKTDPASIAERGCILCEDRLPPEQHAIAYGDAWLILCNPAPLFEPHYTIASIAHQPQRAEAAFEGMIGLARDLEGAFTVFYNGPRSGASLPDHLHLQAIPALGLPFERELAAELCDGAERTRWIQWIARDPVRVGTSRAGRRPAIVLAAESDAALRAVFPEVLAALDEVHPVEPEPMFNLFAGYAEGRWLVWLCPRQAHRPRAYGEGPEDFLISPGAVDLGGLLIAPRPGDVERLDQSVLETLYRDVLLSPARFAQVRDRLADRLATASAAGDS